jgi:hypothetical protein
MRAGPTRVLAAAAPARAHAARHQLLLLRHAAARAALCAALALLTGVASAAAQARQTAAPGIAAPPIGQTGPAATIGQTRQAAAAGVAAAQTRQTAADPRRFAIGLAAGAATFTQDGEAENPASGDVAVTGQALFAPQFSIRFQAVPTVVPRVTVGVARHLAALTDPDSYVTIELGLAFIRDDGWTRGAYTGAGIQFVVRDPVALTVDGRVYLTPLRTGFSLLVGARMLF